MERKLSSWATLGGVFLGGALLLVMYVGAYFLLVQRSPWTHFVREARGGHAIPCYRPTYRVGDGFAQRFFLPAHRVDRCLRWREWSIRNLGGPGEYVPYFPAFFGHE